MPVYAQNVQGISINDLLQSDFSTDDITLIDYIVDEHEFDPGISFENQSSGKFIFKLDLGVDIRELNENRIEGYRINIGPTGIDPLSSLPYNNYQVDIQFRDDFPDLMDTGELDLAKVEQQINKTQEILVANEEELEGIADGRSRLEGTVNNQYVDLNKSTDFSFLARRYLNAGVDPDDACQFSMPVFAMPSSAMSLGASENSSLRIGADTEKMTKYQTDCTSRKSLNDTRSKILSQINRSSPASYKIEQSVVPIEENIRSKIILGKKVNVSSYIFNSVRYFEIPRQFVADDEVIFSITPIVKAGEVDSDDDFIAPAGTQILYQMRNAKLSLFEPEVAPELSVYVNNPYDISYAVFKKDPTTTAVCVEKTYFNNATGETSTPTTKVINFTGNSEMKIIQGESCKNIEPFKTRIRVSALSNGAVTLSRAFWLPSHKSNYYDGSNIYDSITVQAVNILEGINVEVNTNNQEAKKIRLFREDYSRIEKTESIKLLTTFDNETRVPEVVFSHIDTNTVPGRVYRYFTSYDTKHERESSIDSMMNLAETPWLDQKVDWSAGIIEERYSSNDEIIKRLESEKSRLYEVNVARVGSENSGDAVFIPTAEVKDSNIEILLDTLRENGLEGHFGEEISRIKESLPDLPYFSVERISRRAGDRVSIGIVKAGDKITDKVPKVNFERYTYVFKLHLANTLGSLLMAGDREGPAGRESEALNRLTATVAEMTGILPGQEKTDLSIYGTDLLQTGKEITIEDTHNYNFDGSIVLTNNKVPDGYAGGRPGIKLKWSFSHDSSFIDTFYVYCKYKGQKSVIQTIPAIPGVSSNYFYVDTEFCDEVGTKEYSVSAKYTNFTFGPESNIIVETKDTSLPDKILSAMLVFSSTTSRAPSTRSSLASMLSDISERGLF